jgi:hypothetical protein
MATAGTLLGGSAIGCGSIIVDLPCHVEAELPQVALPVIAGMTYLQASKIGCALDCDLTTGLSKYNGGAATDDAPTINAAMATATASHPITLIIDGGALISGLFLPAGGYWGIQGQGCGTGFFIKSGTNNDGIHNGGPAAAIPSDPGPNVPLPARGSSVSLSDFMLNGNAGNGSDGDSTTGLSQGGGPVINAWFFGINLMNLNNITIENVVVVNAPSYHIRVSNAGNVVVSGCVMNSSGLNTDGVHVDGPANDISITYCDFTTGDDSIALNCPEGYSGNISRVSVANCTFNSATCLMRVYPSNNIFPAAFQIDSVTVSKCSGVGRLAGFLVGEYARDNPNAVLSLTVSDCQMTTPAILEITTDFSSISLTNVTMTPFASYDPDFAIARTYFSASRTAYYGASLTLNNCVIQRTGSQTVAALDLMFGSTISQLEVNGFAVQDPGGTSYAAAPELVNIGSGTIGQLTIDGVTSAHLAAPVSLGGFSSIGSISGAGVLASGWEFPDAVMADQTPYISATSGQPSIKVGGVVEPYP